MAIEEAFIMQRARQLYWQGYPPAEIARLMGINPNTVYSWKKRDEWDTTPPIQRVTTSIDSRLIQLTGKDKKTGGDFKEIDLLTRQLKKLDNGTLFFRGADRHAAGQHHRLAALASEGLVRESPPPQPGHPEKSSDWCDVVFRPRSAAACANG